MRDSYPADLFPDFHVQQNSHYDHRDHNGCYIFNFIIFYINRRNFDYQSLCPFTDNFNSKFRIFKILNLIIYIPHPLYKTFMLAIYIYNRFHYSQCPYYLSVIVLSYSFYNLCFI